MQKQIKIDNRFSPPMPVVLVGTRFQGKPNFMAVGWCIRVNIAPPMLAVGIGKGKATAEAILENKCFSVCVPGAAHKDAVDYCGLVSGKKTDKSGLFEILGESAPDMPLLSDFAVNLECKLEHIQELPDHYLFTAEITGAWAREDILADGKPEFEKIDPLLLTMNDNRYWRLGGPVGLAWKDGLKLKKK